MDWDDKFSKEKFLYGKEANNFIKESIIYFNPKSSIISLGEGEGRNAIYLAKQGFSVEALDGSIVGLEKLKKRSKEESLNIPTVHALFDDWTPNHKYDVAICIAFHIHKDKRGDFFKKVLDILNDNGVFICEVFTTKQINFNSGGPRNLEYLYDIPLTYEIINNLPFKIIKFSEEIVHLDEGALHQGKASVLRLILQKSSDDLQAF